MTKQNLESLKTFIVAMNVEEKEKKYLMLGVLVLLSATIVVAVTTSLNMKANTFEDFGVMSPREIKTETYYVGGFMKIDEIYYSICVEHPIEGDVKDWIRLKLDDTDNKTIFSGQICSKKNSLNQHWVGPDLTATFIQNIHVTMKIPPKTQPGNYSGVINNIGCFISSSTVRVCSNVPTTIEVEVR